MSSHFDTGKERAKAESLDYVPYVSFLVACDEVDRLHAALTEAETRAQVKGDVANCFDVYILARDRAIEERDRADAAEALLRELRDKRWVETWTQVEGEFSRGLNGHEVEMALTRIIDSFFAASVSGSKPA